MVRSLADRTFQLRCNLWRARCHAEREAREAAERKAAAAARDALEMAELYSEEQSREEERRQPESVFSPTPRTLGQLG